MATDYRIVVPTALRGIPGIDYPVIPGAGSLILTGLAPSIPNTSYTATHYVAPFASVGGASNDYDDLGVTAWANATSSGTPTTLGTAVARAIGTNKVQIAPGTYTGTDKDDRFIPTFSPVNSGSGAGNELVFFAQFPATHNATNRTIIRNGVTVWTAGASGCPGIGANLVNYVIWDGIYVDENFCMSHPDTGPAVIVGGTGCEFRRCYIYGADGLSVGDNHMPYRLEDCTDAKIRDCKAENNYGANNVWNGSAVVTYDATNSIIEHNEFWDCEGGVFIKGEQNGPGTNRGTVIRYNHIHNCYIGITIGRCVSGAGDFGTRTYQNVINTIGGAGGGFGGFMTRYENDDTYFVNNTIVGVSGIGGYGYYVFPPEAGTSNTVCRNNIIVDAQAAAIGNSELATWPTHIDHDYAMYNGHTIVGKVNSTNYTTLANWQSFSGDDANSEESDPIFVNKAGGDFRLDTGSPALNAGLDYLNLLGGGTGAAINYGAYITAGQTEEIGVRANPTY